MSTTALSEIYTKFTNNLSKSERQKEVFQIANRTRFLINFIFNPSILASSGISKYFNLDDISYLVKSIEFPGVSIGGENEIDVQTVIGSFKQQAEGPPKPSDNTFSITFLDTQHSVCDYFFFPWMAENTKIKKVGNERYPVIRANLEIYLFKNEVNASFNPSNFDIKTTFKLFGVFPNSVDKPNLDYSANDPTRTVNFGFNMMRIYDGSSTNESNELAKIFYS